MKRRLRGHVDKKCTFCSQVNVYIETVTGTA